MERISDRQATPRRDRQVLAEDLPGYRFDLAAERQAAKPEGGQPAGGGMPRRVGQTNSRQRAR